MPNGQPITAESVTATALAALNRHQESCFIYLEEGRTTNCRKCRELQSAYAASAIQTSNPLGLTPLYQLFELIRGCPDLRTLDAIKKFMAHFEVKDAFTNATDEQIERMTATIEFGDVKQIVC